MGIRKGLQCHLDILESYMAGLDLTDQDNVIFLDVMPNRLVKLNFAC